MTKSKFIINPEQCEARRQELRAANPHKEKIAEIQTKILELATEKADLISNEEKYLNLMLMLAPFDNKPLAVSFMSNQELGDHLSSLFFDKTENDLDEAILIETLNRIGWKMEDEDENEDN